MAVEENSNVTLNATQADPITKNQPSNGDRIKREEEVEIGFVSKEEKFNASSSTTQTDPGIAKQPSNFDGNIEAAAGEGIVSEDDDNSNVPGNTTKNRASNGDVKQEVWPGKDVVAAEEDQSNVILNDSEADPQNEKQPSNVLAEGNVAEESRKSRHEEEEAAKQATIAEKGEVATEIVKEEPQKGQTSKEAAASSEFPTVLSSSSYREVNDYLYRLKEFEKKALYDLRAKVQEAILENRLVKESGKVYTNSMNIEKQENDLAKIGGSDDGQTDRRETTGKSKEDLKPKNGTINLWGVPLGTSRGENQSDTILLMFLKAREFIVNDAFEMLRYTLKWRRDNNINSILNEEFGREYDTISYMNGTGRDGHPICYNIVGALGDDKLYEKALGTQEKRERLVRWRIQLMEKAVKELDFKPGGAFSLLQVTDLKDMPAPSRTDFRLAAREILETLRDNYPEFVARNVRYIITLINQCNAFPSKFLQGEN